MYTTSVDGLGAIMFRVRDILVRIRMRIRILGSVPLTDESGCGSPGADPALFFSDVMTTKNIFSLSFYAYSFLEVHLRHSAKIKSNKEVITVRN